VSPNSARRAKAAEPHRPGDGSADLRYLLEDSLDSFDYRPDEPWDSAHNYSLFADWVGCQFTCPLEANRFDYPFASYLMLVRASLTASGKRVPSETLLPDDAVLIVESAGCHIQYGEPKDIDIEYLFTGESSFGVGKLNSFHPNVVRALRVDGKVIDIPKDISKEALRKLLDGGR
jgi:hypothetical protein